MLRCCRRKKCCGAILAEMLQGSLRKNVAGKSSSGYRGVLCVRISRYFPTCRDRCFIYAAFTLIANFNFHGPSLSIFIIRYSRLECVEITLYLATSNSDKIIDLFRIYMPPRLLEESIPVNKDCYCHKTDKFRERGTQFFDEGL